MKLKVQIAVLILVFGLLVAEIVGYMLSGVGQ